MRAVRSREEQTSHVSPFSIKVVALSWLLLPLYVGHRHPSQLCSPVSCAFCHARQHLLHKNNIQLLALKWRLHHMPASHLASARGAGAWLRLTTYQQRRRANLSSSAPPPPIHSLRWPLYFLLTFIACPVVVPSAVFSFCVNPLLCRCLRCPSLRPSMCASSHLLKVLWQRHLVNVNAKPKQVSLQGLLWALLRSRDRCVCALMCEDHLV